jgi:hypothetical protein
LNAYLICLRCTRGSTIRGQSVRGSSPGWKDTFAIDDKGGDLSDAEEMDQISEEDRGMVSGGGVI